MTKIRFPPDFGLSVKILKVLGLYKTMEMLTVKESIVPTFAKTEAEVLCVIDFSESSKEALKSAIFLADQYKTPLTVLYPYRLTQVDINGDMSSTRRSMDQAANESFKKISESLLLNSAVHWQFRPEVGFFNDRIRAHSKKNKVGMLIVSKRLVTINRENFMELIDQLQVPLMIIPQTEQLNS